MDRNAIRTAIFSKVSERFKSARVTFFGVELEVKQPPIGKIMELQDNPDRRKGLVSMLINYCVVPGTSEPVFEEADVESLMGLPFGEDFIRLNKAIESLTSVNVLDAEKNLNGNP